MIVNRSIHGIEYKVDTAKPRAVMFPQEIISQISTKYSGMSLQSVSKYLATFAAHTPLHMTWEMTRRCNLDCDFCYIHDHAFRKTDEVTFAQARPIIDELVNSGLFSVTMTGGECTLLDSFPDIYRYLKEKGVLVTVYTNAVILPDELLAMFVEFPPSSFEISIYTDDINSPVYRNILRLKSAGMNTLCKFTVSRDNIHMKDIVVDWCRDNELDLMIGADLIDSSGKRGCLEQQLITDEFYQIERAKYSDELITKGKCKHIEKPFPCRAYGSVVHITPEFELSLCRFLAQTFPLSDESFNAVYKQFVSYIEEEQQKVITGCVGCDNGYLCHMCSCRAESRADGTFHIPAEHCKAVARRAAKLKELSA